MILTTIFQIIVTPISVGVLSVIVTLSYFYLIFKFNYWKRRGVYHEKPHKFFGNVKDVFDGKKTENQVYNKIYKDMGEERFAGCFYFWQPTVLLKDPDLIKRILITDFDCFADHPSLSDFTKTDKSIWSLFTMEGAMWKDRRNFFSSSFTPRRVKSYLNGISNQMETVMPSFRENMDNGEDLELEEFTSKYLMNVITDTLFGITTDSVENPKSKFVECGKYTVEPSTSTILKIVVRSLFPWLYETLRLQTMPVDLWNSFQPFVRGIVEYRESNNILRDDMMGAMIRRKNSPDQKPEMTLNEMVGHVYAFFEAGFDSTALTTSYCLYELSINPQIQERLRNEIDLLMDSRQNQLTYEALMDLQYMDKVIKETLRKYPPSGLIRRVCTKEYKMDSVVIEKGTQIIIPVEALHMDATYHSDPHMFDPDRTHQHPFTYLPFGAGPRICIGMKVAELTLKVGLFKILSKYIILPSDKHKGPIQYDPKTIFISIRPKNGIWVRVAPRDDSTVNAT